MEGARGEVSIIKCLVVQGKVVVEYLVRICGSTQQAWNMDGLGKWPIMTGELADDVNGQLH